MLTIGQKVKVMIPLNENTASMTIKQFNGKVSTVKSCIQYRGKAVHCDTYTLDGCVGGCEVPYEFFEEWLIPLDEVEA